MYKFVDVWLPGVTRGLSEDSSIRIIKLLLDKKCADADRTQYMN